MTRLNSLDDSPQVDKKSKIQLLKTKIIAITNSSSQQLYFNYTSLLAVGIGASTIQMSFITAIQNLGSSLLQGVFGKASDKFGRKIVLLLGFLIATITTCVLAFMTSPLIFMIIIAIYSLGISMIIPAWNALLGDISTEKTRTKLISTMSMIGTIGSSIILLILGSVTDFLPGKLMNHVPFDIFNYNISKVTKFISLKHTETVPWGIVDKYRIMIFIGSFIFAIAAIVVVLIQETNKNKDDKKNGSFLQTLKDKNFRTLALVTAVWWFIMSFLWPISPFVIKSLNPTNFQVALLSVVFAISSAGGQWVAGKIADKIGRRLTAFIGFVALCCVPLIFAFAFEWYIILFANFFGGMGNGIAIVAMNSEILFLAGSEKRGIYTGVYNVIMGICTFVGSFISGVIFNAMLKNIEFSQAARIFLLAMAGARLIAAIPTLLLSRKGENRKSTY